MGDKPATDIFEQSRPRLQSIAYRMLGTISDAEDAVQDIWLKWQKTGSDNIQDAEAWLVTTCTRHCIDMLRGAQRKRTDYVGVWLPEPVVGEQVPTPLDHVELASSLTTAFMLMLERLNPLERAAWLLREVFAYDYADLAFILDRSEGSCRQLVSRAKKNLHRDDEDLRPVPQADQKLVDTFLHALASGDPADIEQMLIRDATLWADGGGKAIASRRIIKTANNVARFLAGLRRKFWKGITMEPAIVNGSAGLLFFEEGKVVACLSFGLDQQGQIRAVYIMRNPDKLANINK